MENQDKSQSQAPKSLEFTSPKQKSVFTAASQPQREPQLSPHAEPFEPSRFMINIGPSQLAVNAKVWNTIASNRKLPPMIQEGHQHCAFLGPQIPGTSKGEGSTKVFSPMSTVPEALPPMPLTPMAEPMSPLPLSVNVSLPHDAFDFSGFANNNPPAFDSDPSRRILFRRQFGPVATEQGYVDVRLRRGINVLLSLDRAVLIENGEVRIAVSSDSKMCSLEHPNGRVRQVPERIDIVAFDGFNKNKFVRYAKMWKDSISLTARGCCLTYLVDPAGTRTTSDQVNREWSKDYCKEAFFDNVTTRNQGEVDHAAAHYNYKVEEDGTETFTICGVRVSQTRDGMVRVVCNDRYSIRTSAENRSVTVNTPNIYCTASMSDSPHLFIRHFERRIHFDGANFIVRNMGHSASFDTQNLLRIH